MRKLLNRLPNPRSRVYLLTLGTFLGLIFVSLGVGWWAREALFDRLRTSYIEMQTENARGQVERIGRILEEDLGAGVDPGVVQARLQESFLRTPYDESGFVCLLDSSSKVICHPEPGAIGMRVNFQREAQALPPAAEGSEWLTDQGYAGDTHLVVRRSVDGAPWQVSVHVNYGVVDARVETLQTQVTRSGLPAIFGFAILGTFLARGVARGYERKIEGSNRVGPRRASSPDSCLQSSIRRGPSTAVYPSGRHRLDTS